MSMRVDILSIFPDMFEPTLSVSIPGRAREAGLIEWHCPDIRDFTTDKHRKVDDRPFGGGPGMVMMCQPVYDAVMHAEAQDPRRTTRLLMSPQGEPLTQPLVEELAGQERLLIIAGHYEGLDERVIDELELREVSIGDYVLSGGELAAMVLVDSVARLLPGALGHEDSAAEDSFSVRTIPGDKKPGKKREPAEEKRLLDCPHYTRPREWMGRSVPDILMSGDHGKVEQWRLQQMLERTEERRPDLL